MGISVEQYLAKKQACADCITHGEEDHCVSTMLSREDNCLIYNMVWAYHIPNRQKHMSFTTDERSRMSDAAMAEAQLFMALRDKISADTVLEYYTRAQNIVTMIKGIHSNDRMIWSGYYTRFMPKILEHLRGGRDADAMTEIMLMLETLEYTNGRVICTWLRNNGLFSDQDLAVDSQFSLRYLSSTTKIGYWLWACPLVQYMDKNYTKGKSSVLVTAVRIIAQARANEIAYKSGLKPKGDVLGKMTRIFGEGICFILGAIAKPFTQAKFKQWLDLYSTKIR